MSGRKVSDKTSLQAIPPDAQTVDSSAAKEYNSSGTGCAFTNILFLCFFKLMVLKLKAFKLLIAVVWFILKKTIFYILDEISIPIDLFISRSVFK